MKMTKQRFVYSIGSFFLFLACVLMPLTSFANSFVPQDAMLDKTTDRKITIARIKGGSGSLDSASLVDVETDRSAINGILTGGWEVDNEGDAVTYRISKLRMNTPNTLPVDTNFSIIGSVEITTSGGIAEVNLGSETTHIAALESEGFYTKDLDGTVADSMEKGTPDGFYLIEELDVPDGKMPYRQFISMPFVQEIDDGAGESKGRIVYDVHIFPKAVQQVSFGFSTAVNILTKSGVPTTRFADKTVWTHDTVANNSENVWTIFGNFSKTTLANTRSNANPMYIAWDSIYSNKHSTVASGQGNYGVGYGVAIPSEGTGFSDADKGKISNGWTSGWKNAGNNSVGLLITNLNDGTYEYINFGSVAYPDTTAKQQTVTITYNTVSWTLNTYNNPDWATNNSAGISVPASWGDANHLGVNNKLGDKYQGIDLTDPSQGYKVQIAVSYNLIQKGVYFSQEYLGTGGILANNPFHPYEVGFYMVDDTGSHAITTFGIDNEVANGLSQGFAQAADGLKTQDNPNGVFLERAYVTTGSLNADKVNSNDNDLTGAKFVLKVKDTHGENASVEGKYVQRDGTGAISYDTKANATAMTSGSWLANAGSTANTLLGYFQMPGIDPDWDYELEETTAPDTYQLLSKPLLIPSTNISAERFVTDEASGDYIKVVNIKKMLLPVTGGVGLGLLIVVGLLLVIIGQKKKNSLKGSE
ncbi:hypothetical protein SAMN02745116_00163 [Pilibacter termitis]|uniref:SpaA-like prealbumin fold domain-containing protein n=1 Tax=Pilibacter termitis TaxID=263852 RepID=A0A1T4KB50_9ENTE|nr:hypothetical protein [Pilibacter termitis]SJZ39616.1 hypothetical protein SAMN02745116_00163 [Pilibacter termitis]